MPNCRHAEPHHMLTIPLMLMAMSAAAAAAAADAANDATCSIMMLTARTVAVMLLLNNISYCLLL